MSFQPKWSVQIIRDHRVQAMLYWSLMFLFVALTAGAAGHCLHCAGARKILTGPHPHTRSDWATYFPRWLRRLRVRALAGARKIRS